MQKLKCPESEYNALYRLLYDQLGILEEDEIDSGGYVVSTLEASIWCVLTTDSFSEAVFKAVNLGDDSDTTGAVTGGLAALLYGYDTIPQEWVDSLVKPEIFTDLIARWELRQA